MYNVLHTCIVSFIHSTLKNILIITFKQNVNFIYFFKLTDEHKLSATTITGTL